MWLFDLKFVSVYQMFTIVLTGHTFHELMQGNQQASQCIEQKNSGDDDNDVVVGGGDEKPWLFLFAFVVIIGVVAVIVRGTTMACCAT